MNKDRKSQVPPHTVESINTARCVAVKDANYRYRACTVNFAKAMGFDHPEQLIGRTDFDLFPEEYAKEQFSVERKILRTGHGCKRDISLYKRAANATLERVPIKNSEGRVNGFDIQLTTHNKPATPIPRSPKQPGKSPLLDSPLLPAFLRLGIPGLCIGICANLFFAIEVSFLSGFGTEVLAAAALVFPFIFLAPNLSAGSFGGAIIGAVARARGAGDQEKFESVVTAAFVVAIIGATMMYAVYSLFAVPVFSLSTSDPEILKLINTYVRIVFPALALYWFLNAISSVMRGCGDVVRPAISYLIHIGSYVLYSWFFVWSESKNAHDAISGAGSALVFALLVGFISMVVLYLVSGRREYPKFCTFHFQTTMQLFRQGSLASTQAAVTILYAMSATTLFARLGTDWLAGYGMVVRLEMLLAPFIFGLGSALIPICGAYVGASRRKEAIRIAWFGISILSLLVGISGVVLGLKPTIWCSGESESVVALAQCQQAMQLLGPTYVFVAIGNLCLIASQAMNSLKVPAIGAILRLLIVSSGLFWVTSATDANLLLWLLATGLIAYGVFTPVLLYFGAWSTKENAENKKRKIIHANRRSLRQPQPQESIT